MSTLMILTSVTGLINAAIILIVGVNADPIPRTFLCCMAIFGAFSSAALFGIALRLAGAVQ